MANENATDIFNLLQSQLPVRTSIVINTLQAALKATDSFLASPAKYFANRISYSPVE